MNNHMILIMVLIVQCQIIFKTEKMAYYRQNMLSIYSRTLLSELFQQVLALSQSIQIYRNCLARLPYFDCIALFRFLDRQQKGYLREKDFQRAVGTNHRKLLSYAFSWFDSMKVGQISRLQFAAFLLPKDDLHLREIVAKRVQNPQISYSQHQTILQQFELFQKLLTEIMNYEMKLIELRRKLIDQNDYSITAVLLALDGHSHNWICCEDIYNFMKNYGSNAIQRQIEKLVQVINYTLDGKVNQSQLKWIVQGFQTKNKIYLNKIKKANKKEILNGNKQKQQKLKYINCASMQLKDKDGNQNQITKHFQLIMNKFKSAQAEERQIDLLLKKKEIQINSAKKHSKYLNNESNQQNQQIQKENDKYKLSNQELIQKYSSKSIHELRRRAIQLEDQSKRLKAIEDRLNNQKKQQLSANYQTFWTEDSVSPKKVSPTKQMVKTVQPNKSPYSSKKYEGLTDLNCLSVVQSHRPPSEQVQSFFYNQSSNNILQNANQIKQRIKRQIQIEKNIQYQFSKGKYSTNKFKNYNVGSNSNNQRQNTNQFNYLSGHSVKVKAFDANQQNSQKKDKNDKTNKQFTCSKAS